MGGSVGKTIGRAGLAGVTGGLSEFAQANPFGASVNNPINPLASDLTKHLGIGLFGPAQGQSNPYIPGQFSLDPNQLANDTSGINNLADQQYKDIQSYNTSDQNTRAQSRQALSDALTKQSQAYFNQGLPATEETLNAQHLLNGSGLGQEIARQQGNLAANIANQVGVQGSNDINRASDIELAGLQGKQGLNQSALSRGFSLEDFINQANVAKTIGAQTAPQVSNGKGQTGALLSGVGATAPLIGAVKGFGKGGPAGAAAGGFSGLV